MHPTFTFWNRDPYFHLFGVAHASQSIKFLHLRPLYFSSIIDLNARRIICLMDPVVSHVAFKLTDFVQSTGCAVAFRRAKHTNSNDIL